MTGAPKDGGFAESSDGVNVDVRHILLCLRGCCSRKNLSFEVLRQDGAMWQVLCNLLNVSWLGAVQSLFRLKVDD